ncbi:MAG TPA: FmdB family zinc ribbon protein [Sporichthyaceae bacterium]
MPTYQYACTECGHELEAVQKFTDDPLTQCPSCAGKLRKVFSAVGVVFKGSGFYRTDSRGKNSAAEAGSSSSGSSSEKSSTSSTSSESTKSESATPAKKGSGESAA